VSRKKPRAGTFALSVQLIQGNSSFPVPQPMEQVKFTDAEQGCLPPWEANQPESVEIIVSEIGA
jgi:aromatic ring-cleaving dioxygenase